MKNKARKTNDNKPIRGLWVRGRKYYAQMIVSWPDGSKHETKVPLKATNLTEAREAHRKLLVQRSEGDATYYGECSKFWEYAQLYLKQQQGRKAEGTLVVERGHIRLWTS